MKTKLPNLTKSQRHRLFLLARLLDKVPKKHFDMSWWMEHKPTHNIMEAFPDQAKLLSARKCGYAGCACGWGMTRASIRGSARSARKLFKRLAPLHVGLGLFSGSRQVGPRRVAADIRRYLKSGMLP